MRRRRQLAAGTALAGAAALAWLALGGGSRPGAQPAGPGRAAVQERGTYAPQRPPLDARDAWLARPAVGSTRAALGGPPADRLAGRLVDAVTDEPVPHLALAVRHPDRRREPLVSDEEGRFATEGVLRGGAVTGGTARLVLGEEGRFDGHRTLDVELPAAGQELVVAVQVGPTYRLDFDPPPGVALDDWRAELLDHRRVAGQRPAGSPRSHLRAGDPLWVRLQPDEVTRGPGPPWWLTVVSRDGLWRGEVAARSRVGVHPGRLPLVVHATGCLRGTVRDTEGAARRAFLRLERLDGAWQTAGQSGAQGQLAFPGLEPGDYRLRAGADGHEPWDATLRVVAGEETRAGPVLTRLSDGGAIAGVVRCGSGGTPRLEVHLRPARPTGFVIPRRARVVWEDGAEPGDALGRFRFDDVPAGEYTVRVDATAIGARCEPASRTVEPPATDLAFRVDDGGASAAFELWVPEAPPGARVRLDLGSGRGLEVRLRRGEPTPLLGRFALDGHFRWVLLAPGHRLAQGDEGAFEPVDGRRRASVSLEPGWGALLELIGPLGRPAAGVALTLDGERTAPSDAQGVVAASLERRPEELAGATPGWRLGLGNLEVDPASGRFTGREGGPIRILVERDR